jgi:ribosomal protein L29
MAKGTTAKDLIAKSDIELNSYIDDATKNLLDTRFRNHANLLDDTSRIAKLRHDLARALTVRTGRAKAKG